MAFVSQNKYSCKHKCIYIHPYKKGYQDSHCCSKCIAVNIIYTVICKNKATRRDFVVQNKYSCTFRVLLEKGDFNALFGLP